MYLSTTISFSWVYMAWWSRNPPLTNIHTSVLGMPLYCSVEPGSIYIRNFRGRGGALLDHISFHTAPQRMEVMLIPNQPTNFEHLIQFTRDTLSNSLIYSQSASFHYVAQIDWSLLQSQYKNINNLVDSLSCGRDFSYHLAFTNIVPGDRDSRSTGLDITVTGGTAGVHLNLPLHGFLDDGLAIYLSSPTGLPYPLTEICVEDTIPLDATTLLLASRNLAQLLKAKADDIQRAKFSITLPQIHLLISELPRLYDLTFTHPDCSTISTLSLEHDVLTSLSQSSNNASPRISSPSSYFSTISVLALPAHLFASPLIRNQISRLRRLQELKIFFTSPFSVSNFGHLPAHQAGDFGYLRCLTFEGGTIPQFTSLLPTLFCPPFSSSSPRSSNSYPNSSVRSSSSLSSFTHGQRPRKFLNLTLLIPSLSSSSSLTRLVSAINTYIPHGVDIFKLHVKEWGVGEPTDGGWWTKAGVCVQGGNDSKDRRALNFIQVPGRVMTDLVHPCREEAGSQTEMPSRVKRVWRKMVTRTRKETRIMNVEQSLGSAENLAWKMLNRWWSRWRNSKAALSVWWWRWRQQWHNLMMILSMIYLHCSFVLGVAGQL